MIDRSILATAEFEHARQRIALALDVDTLEEAVSLTSLLHPYVGTVKVGLELFIAEGRKTVAALHDLDVDVFLDLKLHDIPTTVEKSSRVVGTLGVRYLTLHTSGGSEMVRAGVNGLIDGAASAGVLPPIAVGVTVLTSDVTADHDELVRRATLGAEAGCGALVCAAPDLVIIRDAAPQILTIVPGTRPAGVAKDDQSRTATPREALMLGADLLVVGRPITKAPDPEQAAFDIAISLIG
jgi:orotidine-5'-phosphate decarboxylase